MRIKVSIYVCLILIHLWFPITSSQTNDGPSKCVIVQEKEYISIGISLPSFLKDRDKSQCQTKDTANDFLRCGKTDVYIRPTCVCSFFNVYEASLYHTYSSCPEGDATDDVTQLTCTNCRRYSLGNNGPCINGGNLTCKGNEVAPDITCLCPPNYIGMFCETKIENVTRICKKISNSSTYDLRNCATTGKDCITYSKNKRYTYRCPEVHTSQARGELPLCIDTEDFNDTLVAMGNKSVSQQDYTSTARISASTSNVIWTFLLLLLSSMINHLCRI
uniref:Uncharacterized protein LOC111137335 n=1 Tax=Crassostrea virginica TaxID=6565 RepID=A0A8B8EY32_CRAVI|nr:uncharacterized protein LOC111137335 [Crassostrea virginica]XP_022344479.1 uncharacterized protein LOC111137335 [Crassostrea virginica]XP_022344480.1 uncharacterized protein LOC111137335 [Crassostrea virginica]